MEKQFVYEIRTLLAMYYTDANFDYATLCQALALSRSQVYRKFQEHCLGSPANYIRNFRLEKGKTLLLETNLTIKEIAHQIGFVSASHFTKKFNAAYDCSPTEFRENNS